MVPVGSHELDIYVQSITGNFHANKFATCQFGTFDRNSKNIGNGTELFNVWASFCNSAERVLKLQS